MANFHIGLDFGTSQTKACLFNTDNKQREFVVFENDTFFIPTLITKTVDNFFLYGNESAKGVQYRYFKMATAEDDQLIQVTKEDINGNLLSKEQIESFKRYNEVQDIKPELLSILFLTYVFLFIKEKYSESRNDNNAGGGLLGRFSKNVSSLDNIFSIKMGIPTEWHNPNHIKRKIKFETILIVVSEFANTFRSIDAFLKTPANELLSSASVINKKHSDHIESLEPATKKSYIEGLLNKHKLSVFPETAGGISFLLATKQLKNGYYGAMDIGGGTSDISIFKVVNNAIVNYLCSESVEIASNNVYSKYLELENKKIKYSEIKLTEQTFRDKGIININFKEALSLVGGDLEFALRKTFYRKYYKPFRDINSTDADLVKNHLNGKPIILYGGGSNFSVINEGGYMFFRNPPTARNLDNSLYFEVRGIVRYISQIEIKQEEKVRRQINLLALALGLSYLPESESVANFFSANDIQNDVNDSASNDKYFYYDIQDAVFK